MNFMLINKARIELVPQHEFLIIINPNGRFEHLENVPLIL